MSFPVFTPNGVVTTSECPECGGVTTIEHGHVALYDSEAAVAIEETSIPQHCERCADCEYQAYPRVCYDCEHCLKSE